jgi:hypothetical protein
VIPPLQSCRFTLLIQISGLESTMRSLQQKLAEAERRLAVAEKTAKRVTEERDELVTQVGAAWAGSDNVKKSNDVLTHENDILRERIDNLDHLVRDLQVQLDNLRQQHDQETQDWVQRETQLKRRSVAKESSQKLVDENNTLREQLARVKELQQRQARRNAEKAAEIELAKLQAQNEDLQSKFEQARSERDGEIRRWAKQEAAYRLSIKDRDDTIEELANLTRNLPQSAAANELRKHNAELAAMIEKLQETAKPTLLADQESKRTRSVSHNTKHAGASSSAHVRRASAPPGDLTRSTTDPSIALAQPKPLLERPTAAAGKGKSTKLSAGPATIPAPAEDEGDTVLSFIPEQVYAEIRRKVEIEHLAEKYGRGPLSDHVAFVTTDASAAKATARSRASSIGSNVSEASYRLEKSFQGFGDDTQKSGCSCGSKDETRHSRRSSAGTEDTQRSRRSSVSQDDTRNSDHLSRSSRVRVPYGPRAEMTSALLVPDITLEISKNRGLSKDAHATLDKLAPHDPSKCTVCRRVLDSDVSIEIPMPIPVSSQDDDNIDATIRPSESPLEALSRVIKEVEDEIAHLKLNMHFAEQRLAAHLPSGNRRERRNIYRAIASLNRDIEAKSGQLYSLYDVLEAHKGEIPAPREPLRSEAPATKLSEFQSVSADDEITERVEAILETIRSYGSAPSASKQLKVNIAAAAGIAEAPAVSTPVAAIDLAAIFGQEHISPVPVESTLTTDEFPWEGFSETDSICSRTSSRSRRSA